MSKRTHYGYGFFCGGDPRKFFPDAECCTAQELKAHREACEFWNEAESRGEDLKGEKCPSGWELFNGQPCHVLRSRYGIGGYEFEMDDGDDDCNEQPQFPADHPANAAPDHANRNRAADALNGGMG